MIVGTILDDKPRRTAFGLEYRVMYDDNPDAKAQSGCEGPAITNVSFGLRHGGDIPYRQGDRVVLQYRSSRSYGLWFIIRKVGQCRSMHMKWHAGPYGFHYLYLPGGGCAQARDSWHLSSCQQKAFEPLRSRVCF